ncbi:class I SAM-dependent methyltransferase [Kitasatospora sp. CM 4170]|uniref:Class I SAM-dependent methyltransferase n=1 Tax=Kitasatospora aburaviensis TaxID=67265 RepID=A0ABW1F0I1_9ACTN|nr:class I SAM-dependent methyltransferase [Kitasatospora sp. CM 4170]WNM46421.1 class I SAM-dependent methyltransferase [Kitasatospora sp. CM 4170]
MTEQRDYRELAGSFGSVASEYDRARPTYPEELFDELERLAGRPLKGARVLDVGAGTGIATRLLAARGAAVVAVEPSDGMGAQFLASSPGLPLVRGSGDELPFHDDSADLVTYAQAFHWTRAERSIPEAIRVLRPGGALATFWNVKDSGVPWVRAMGERLAAALPETYHGYGAVNEIVGHLAPFGLRTGTAVIRWERRVTVDHVITDLTSRSYLAALDPERREPLLAVERDALLAEFPDGWVVEPYVLDLTVAITPG